MVNVLPNTTTGYTVFQVATTLNGTPLTFNGNYTSSIGNVLLPSLVLTPNNTPFGINQAITFENVGTTGLQTGTTYYIRGFSGVNGNLVISLSNGGLPITNLSTVSAPGLQVLTPASTTNTLTIISNPNNITFGLYDFITFTTAEQFI